MDIRVNHQKIGEFIKYQESRFIKEREIEFREKKKEILNSAALPTSSPSKPSDSLLMSSFRVQKD